jgi:hypothetical protein
MNKGYLIPLTLVFLLVILAGIMLFGLKSDNSQSVDNTKIQEIVDDIQNTNHQNSSIIDTFLDGINQNTNVKDDTTMDVIDTQTEDSSTDTQAVSNQMCTDTSDCAPSQTCFIRPSDTQGYCF